MRLSNDHKVLRYAPALAAFADQHLIETRLRRADQNGYTQLLDYLKPVVEAIPAHYPETRITCVEIAISPVIESGCSSNKRCKWSPVSPG
jgi:hypothetical protein